MFDAPLMTYKLVCDGSAVLEDAFKRTRKAHECAICAGVIQRGERVRTETRRGHDGEIVTRRVCPTCSEAVAAWVDGDAAPINARHDIGAGRTATAGAP